MTAILSIPRKEKAKELKEAEYIHYPQKAIHAKNIGVERRRALFIPLLCRVDVRMFGDGER